MEKAPINFLKAQTNCRKSNLLILEIPTKLIFQPSQINWRIANNKNDAKKRRKKNERERKKVVMKPTKWTQLPCFFCMEIRSGEWKINGGKKNLFTHVRCEWANDSNQAWTDSAAFLWPANQHHRHRRRWQLHSFFSLEMGCFFSCFLRKNSL